MVTSFEADGPIAMVLTYVPSSVWTAANLSPARHLTEHFTEGKRAYPENQFRAGRRGMGELGQRQAVATACPGFRYADHHCKALTGIFQVNLPQSL